MTLCLQSFALRLWWKPRAFKPTWKISSLNKRKRRLCSAGEEYISTPVHIKYEFSSEVPQRLHSISMRLYMQIMMQFLSLVLWEDEFLHPPTALAAEQQGVKLNHHSPLIHAALGSCAWSFPLKMSSIVTFFLEARLSSSAVSRTFGQYYKNRQEN